MLIRTLKLGTISDNISDTKYDILKAWIEHYGEDSTKINRLIKIYTLVQRIKYELGLKDEGINRKLKFGHYTSGKALQSILGKEYKEDKDPFSISGKRISNYKKILFYHAWGLEYPLLSCCPQKVFCPSVSPPAFQDMAEILRLEP